MSRKLVTAVLTVSALMAMGPELGAQEQNQRNVNPKGVGLLLIIKSMTYEYANSVSRRKSSGMGGVGPTS
jgi:hypothetical protein